MSGLLVTAAQCERVSPPAALASRQTGRYLPRRASSPRRFLVTLHLALLAALVFTLLPQALGAAPRQAAAMPAPPEANVVLANAPGVPASIVVTGGSPQSTATGTVFAGGLQATVRDSASKPVPGKVVTFSAPASGASGSFAGGETTAVTNTNGVATAAVFTANGVAGSYQVSASVAGVATHANFALTNTTSGFAVTVVTTGAGAVSPGSGNYSGVVSFAAIPADASQLFLGWKLDGRDIGFRNPLALDVRGALILEADFASRPNFTDIASGSPTGEAIVQLAARGIVKGYGDGTFGPADGVLRAQIAALVVRMMDWETIAGAPPPFTDLASVDPELQRDIAALAAHGALKGYGDGTFGPTNELLHIQVILVISRAMVDQGYWDRATADDPTIYTNVRVAPDDRLDLVTFVQNAGAIPDQPTSERWNEWASPASRGWTARLLWQAYSSYFDPPKRPMR